MKQREEKRKSSDDGVIVSHYGISVEVLFRSGERRLVRVKRNSGHVVGDQVSVHGEVLTRHPRSTELRRRDVRGGVHLVAANLDVLGIVVAPLSPTGFIDRAVVAARAAGLDPFVVVNKCDLPEGEAFAATVTATYQGGFPVFAISAKQEVGLEPLRDFFRQGHRGAFVGSTGVGKSSLLNALCPGIDLKVGETSEYKRLGRHTTTVSSLHQLPDGGELVDTPGFRDFGLVDISAPEVALYFPGFEKAERDCRFNNCRHRSEPGCAVVELVESGAVSRDRYRTYQTVLTEVEAAEEAARRAPRRS